MAAYAALVSLMNLLEQIQNHPRPPVTLDEEQAESLKKRIAYFQEFLEVYNSHYANEEMEWLRDSIADAAYAAEDFIESYVVNQILGQSTSHNRENIISLLDFVEDCSSLQDQIANRILEQLSTEDESKISSTDSYRALQKFIEHTKFLQKEGCSHIHSNSLQSQIADQLLDQDSTEDEAKISSVHLYRALQILIEHMDFLKEEVMEVKDTIGTQDQLQSNATPPAVSSSSPSLKEKKMVGNDDVLHEILDKLTGQPADRQIISISGMGGIGKTTLARNVFKNQLIVEHFDICSWITISQDYNIREILLEVLLCLPNEDFDYTKQEDSLLSKSLGEKTEEELKQILHKSLFGRRYLIIMDDIWGDEVWDKIKLFCPDNKNGSRIIVTTRLSNLALYLSGSRGIELDFLDQDKSWSLLCKTVFVEEDCPPELKDIGRMIAKSCKGLPLSIVVIGGLLANFKQEREHWESIAEDLNSNVNLEENEMCLKILYKSYEQLPVHLKACFLYLGVFPEDRKVRVSELIRLWAAEGFLKPISGKTLEESAEIYLMDLIDRNLILVGERGSFGKLKFCNMHDLLRDLCLRQAEEEKFLFLNTPTEGINAKRRIAIHQCKEKIPHCLRFDLATRSLINYIEEYLPLVKLRLLRVLHFCIPGLISHFSQETPFQLVNLRYLATSRRYCTFMISSSVSLWNLQTLIIDSWYNEGFVPLDIWKMHRLRHVKFCNFVLLDPPNCNQIDGQDDIVLENLQTLVGIQNFKCSEEMVKRIPNVKKLVISYFLSKTEDVSEYCLDNLFRLHKLESLGCYFNPDIQQEFESLGWHFHLDSRPFHSDLLRNLSFPDSLKKLTLGGTCLFWEDMSTKIGSLPHLQVLKLKARSFIGHRWETIEGQFRNLKYLLISYCTDLEYWTAESTHFPCLMQLVLKGLHRLKEIPSDVGEIPTLQSIHLDCCSNSAIISAKQILDEQQDLGNVSLRVHF